LDPNIQQQIFNSFYAYTSSFMLHTLFKLLHGGITAHVQLHGTEKRTLDKMHFGEYHKMVLLP
jgi:hypothetical protein